MNSVGVTQTYRTRLGTQQPKVDTPANFLAYLPGARFACQRVVKSGDQVDSQFLGFEARSTRWALGR
jgi:hypothetical protein